MNRNYYKEGPIRSYYEEFIEDGDCENYGKDVAKVKVGDVFVLQETKNQTITKSIGFVTGVSGDYPQVRWIELKPKLIFSVESELS